MIICASGLPGPYVNNLNIYLIPFCETAPRKFQIPKNPLKPAPTLHPKTMTVQLRYHDVFFILPPSPHSRTLPTSPTVASCKGEASSAVASAKEGYPENYRVSSLKYRFVNLFCCGEHSNPVNHLTYDSLYLYGV